MKYMVNNNIKLIFLLPTIENIFLFIIVPLLSSRNEALK